jgi:ATP-dependent RNA helicase DDX5/DBP2
MGEEEDKKERKLQKKAAKAAAAAAAVVEVATVVVVEGEKKKKSKKNKKEKETADLRRSPRLAADTPVVAVPEIEGDASKAKKKDKKRKRAEAEAQAAQAAMTAVAEVATDKKAAKKIKKDKEEAAADAGGGVTADGSMTAAAYRAAEEISSVGEAVLPDPVQSFDTAPFAKALLVALKAKVGFVKPSPIQAQAWPIALQGKDMIAVAKTGSGKTLSFLIPIMHRIMEQGTPAKPGCPRALVLAPTRELVQQIKGAADQVNPAVGGIKCEMVYGGTPLGPQLQALKGKVDLLCATPGRLVDALERKVPHTRRRYIMHACHAHTCAPIRRYRSRRAHR